MDIDDILSAWEEDAAMSPTEIGNESIKTAKLHHKYLQMLVQERLILKKHKFKYKKMYKEKWEYFLGFMSQEQLEEKGWDPIPLKIIKQDVDKYIEADDQVSAMQLLIEYQEEKIEALESIIKTINNRGFQIKNYIDWERFKTGS
jgi:hypothetical protein